MNNARHQIRKPRVVEDHYDDLGDDMSGLNDYLAYLMADYRPDEAPSTCTYDTSIEEFEHGRQHHFFWNLTPPGIVIFIPTQLKLLEI